MSLDVSAGAVCRGLHLTCGGIGAGISGFCERPGSVFSLRGCCRRKQTGGKKNASKMTPCVCSVPEGVSVGAVVLLDEDCCSPTLLELPLLVETPEMTLDQDGCQGHPLIKCILKDKKATHMHVNPD